MSWYKNDLIKATDSQSLMYQGIGIAAVVGAMGYFLSGGKRS